jgi:Fic family protein
MELNDLLKQVDQLKAELDALRPIDAAQERRIMQKFRLDWTFHSNSIEGNKLTYGETKAFLLHGITAQGKPFRDYLDIKGHHKAIDYLLEIIRYQNPFTEADVRELHKAILVEPYAVAAKTPDGRLTKRRIEPGQYKTLPNHVETSTGEIHYYATPEETPAKMAELVDWYRREQVNGELHPLILAATFHYQFVAIHPFDDGNGRMARLLMNLIFMQAGFPPVIIRTEDKNNYLLALEQADTGDLELFIVNIGNELLNSLDLFLRGAKGEDIDEIDDLDKKLALLEKKLESEKQALGPEKGSLEFLSFLDNVLGDFLSNTLFHLTKFDKLFSKGHLTLECGIKNKKRLLKIPITNTKNLIKEFVAETKQEMQNINKYSLNYIWKGIAVDADFRIDIYINILFHQFRFEVTYEIRNHQITKTLMSEKYDIILSKEDLQRLGILISNDVLEIIDKQLEK